MRLARVLLQKARRSRGPDLHGLRLQGFSATHGGGFFRGCTARYDEMPKPGLRAALAHSFQAAAPGSIHDAAAGPIVGIPTRLPVPREICVSTRTGAEVLQRWLGCTRAGGWRDVGCSSPGWSSRPLDGGVPRAAVRPAARRRGPSPVCAGHGAGGPAAARASAVCRFAQRSCERSQARGYSRGYWVACTERLNNI